MLTSVCKRSNRCKKKKKKIRLNIYRRCPFYSNLASCPCSVARSGTIPHDQAIFVHLELIHGLLLVLSFVKVPFQGPSIRRYIANTASHTLTRSDPRCVHVSIFIASPLETIGYMGYSCCCCFFWSLNFYLKA